jgi:hypothetical protein
MVKEYCEIALLRSMQSRAACKPRLKIALEGSCGRRAFNNDDVLKVSA